MFFGVFWCFFGVFWCFFGVLLVFLCFFYFFLFVFRALARKKKLGYFSLSAKQNREFLLWAAAWKTTTKSSPARYRTGKSVSYARWPFEAPSKVPRPPPCGSTSSSANRTRRTDLHLRVCANCALRTKYSMCKMAFTIFRAPWLFCFKLFLNKTIR